MKRNIFLILLIILSANFIYAQTKSLNYVDIHNHISMKNYMRGIDNPDSIEKSTPFLKYENWYSLNNNFNSNAKSAADNFFQSDFTNLAESGFKIICASITPFEQNSMYSSMKRTANSGFETHISADRLANAFASTPIKDFFAEMYFLKNQKSIALNKSEKYEFKVVDNNKELQECYKQGKTAFVTTIEGGHVLYGYNVKQKNGFLNPNCPPALEKEILDNIKKLKNYETRILFMGICHLFANKLAGHAKALDVGANTKFNKFVLQKIISISNFIPVLPKLLDIKTYEGLRDGNVTTAKKYTIDTSQIGYKTIRALLDSNNIHNKPILIDIKHMDIKTRMDYYAILDSVPSYKNIPIICSHAAASGKNQKLALITGSFPYYDNYLENRKPSKFYRKHWKSWKKNNGLTDNDLPSQVNFLNPFSINLYDEEIKRIYDSKGMIGIIFEQRSLGGYMNGYSWERNDTIENILKNKYKLNSNQIAQYFNSEPFLRNLFYFVEKSGRNDSSAFDALTIGSDMDGFIDPINSCLTSAHIPNFVESLELLIPFYLQIQYGNDKLLYGLTPKQVVNKVFSENATNFILNHF